MCYVSMNDDIVNSLLSKTFQRIYISHCYKICDQSFQILSFSLKRPPPMPQMLKHCSTVLGNANYFYGKGQEHPDGTHWKRITEKDQTDHSGKSRSKERRAQSRHGHRNLQSCSCDVDEKLTSQMKRMKDVEMEIECLREKLYMFRLKLQ